MFTSLERQHFNVKGLPKKAWPNRVEADRFAYALSVLKPRTRPTEAYRCALCHQFHIGPSPRGIELMRVELGQRVLDGLLSENHRKPAHRRYTVRHRARRAGYQVAA